MKYSVFLTILCGALAAVKQCDPAARKPFCTMIYAPVCGTKADGTTQTFSSPCMACADAQTVSYEDSAGCDGLSHQRILFLLRLARPRILFLLPQASGLSVQQVFVQRNAIKCMWRLVVSSTADFPRTTQIPAWPALTNLYSATL